MITEYKIKVFYKYNGDIESWLRSGSKKESSIMSDKDWHDIDTFIQDLYLLQKGLTSLEFNNTLINKLNEYCENEEVITRLKELAAKK